MKKLLSVLLILTMIFMLVACGSEDSDNTGDETAQTSGKTDAEPTAQPTERDESETADSEAADAKEDSSEMEISAGSEDGEILVAYFSKTGNTETIANMIADITGGDLFKVETVNPYPESYNETVDIAKEEQDSDARPELSTHVEDMSQYDVIYLGFPNWWGTMPMAMFTFLEEYDFTGKTIVPFCTHGGSALGSSEADIAELVPDAELREGLAVSGSRVGGAQEEVEEWISGLGL